MILRSGIVFERKEEEPPQKKVHKRRKKLKDLNGDSGVGQAPEFPFKSLKETSTLTPRRPIFSLHRFRLSRVLSKVGTVLIILSILGALVTYGPILRVELGYRLSRLSSKTEETPKGSFADVMNKTFIEEPDGVPDPNFSLIIPKIHAKSKIIANVDPSSETEYFEALKSGVAHAEGTYFPGSQGNIYLFAHSTDSPFNILRYNAVFYLLRELEPGDEVYVYFSGVKHRYIVSDKKIIEPTDVSYLSAANTENTEQLILQTCWPPGTTLKRLMVFAKKPQ